MHLFFILSSPFLQPLLTIDNCSLLSTFLGLSHLMCLPPHPANIPSALWHQPLISFMVQYVPKHLSKLLLHSALTYGSARPHRYQELSTRKKEGCPSNLLLATHSLQRVINGARFCKESCLKLKKNPLKPPPPKSPKQMSWQGGSTNCHYYISAGKIPHCLTHSAFLFTWEGKLCFQMLCTAPDEDKHIYRWSYNWAKPWSSSLLHATCWGDLCTSGRGDNILLRVRQTRFHKQSLH